MNNVNGWLIVWGLAIGIIAIAFAVIIRLERRAHKKLYRAWLTDMAQKNDEIHDLVKSVAEARAQRDNLNLENESLHQAIGEQAKQNLDLHKQNTKLREELQETKATVELLRMPSDHATVPLVEAAPMAYSEAKPAIEQAAATSKPRRKKAGA